MGRPWCENQCAPGRAGRAGLIPCVPAVFYCLIRALFATAGHYGRDGASVAHEGA